MDESGESDSVDEEELMREFAKAKAERELKKQQLQERLKQRELEEQEEILASNPLLTSQLKSELSDSKQDYSLKKKWYEETVFNA